MSYPRLLQRVECPADRGDKPYSGRIMQVGDQVHTTVQNQKYVWCLVQRLDGAHSKHVWPSHRLGFNLEGPDYAT